MKKKVRPTYDAWEYLVEIFYIVSILSAATCITTFALGYRVWWITSLVMMLSSFTTAKIGHAIYKRNKRSSNV